MQVSSCKSRVYPSDLSIISEREVLLDPKGPVNVEHVLVQRQHEHDKHEQGVEHREEEDRFVPQLLQSGGDFSLKNDID